MKDLQKTPLNAAHRALGATLVDFGGWEMPVTYSDIRSEHVAVRERAGLFDISHMGRIRLRGPDADALAGRVQSCDVREIEPGRTRYALILNPDGGVVDDILVSREADGLLLVVNAGNRATDLDVLHTHADGMSCAVVDDSERLAMVAVQGPASAAVLRAVGIDVTDLRYYRFGTWPSAFGEVLASRTGYTGEVGYELLVDAARVEDLWDALLAAGAPSGLVPCGLGARDTLRLEAGMPLHGHEIGPDVNPYEAGLDFAVRSPLPFVGAEALARIRASGPRRRLVGLLVDGPRIPREGCEVVLAGEVVGFVCSGTRSPTLGTNIATALVASEATEADGYTIRIRRHEASARRTPLPFYRRRKEPESDATP